MARGLESIIQLQRVNDVHDGTLPPYDGPNRIPVTRDDGSEVYWVSRTEVVAEAVTATVIDLSLPPYSLRGAQTEAEYNADPYAFDLWPILSAITAALAPLSGEVIRGVRILVPPGIWCVSRPWVPVSQMTLAGSGKRHCEIRGLYPGGWLIDTEDSEALNDFYDPWYATGIPGEPWALVLGSELIQDVRHVNFGLESDLFSLAPNPGGSYAQDSMHFSGILALESVNLPGDHAVIAWSGGAPHLDAPLTEAWRVTCLDRAVHFAVTTETGAVVSVSTPALTIGQEYWITCGYSLGVAKIWLGAPGGICAVVNSASAASGTFIREELWHRFEIGGTTTYFPGSTIHRVPQHCRIRSIAFGRNQPFPGAAWTTGAAFTAPTVLGTTNPFAAGRLNCKIVFGNAALDSEGRPQTQALGRIGDTNFFCFQTVTNGTIGTTSAISRYRNARTQSVCTRFGLEYLSFKPDGASGRGSGCVYQHNNVGGWTKGCIFYGLNGLVLGHDGYDCEVSDNEFYSYMTGWAAYNNAFGESFNNRFVGGYMPISTWGFWSHTLMHTDVGVAAYSPGIFCCENGRYSSITLTQCTFGHESSTDPFTHGVILTGNGGFRISNCNLHFTNQGTQTWESCIYIMGSQQKSVTIEGGWWSFWGNPPSGVQYLIEFDTAPTSVVVRVTGANMQTGSDADAWRWSNYPQAVEVDGRPAPRPLFDADTNISIADAYAFEVRPPVPSTANRDHTLATTDAELGDRVWAGNRDTSAFAHRIIGANVTGAPITIPQGKRFPLDFDGTNWVRGPGTEPL